VRGLELDPVSLELPYAVWHLVLTATVVLTAGSLLVPLAVLLGRFRRADAERRAQLTWLVLAAVLAAAVMLSSRVLPPSVTGLVLPVAVALVSAAVLVAVSRYRLYDVDLLVGWTVLYGALAGLVVLVDVVVFGLAGSVVSSRESALAATFVVALLYGPLRVRLHHLVQRLVRGNREDPYAVVSALAERLEDSSDPDGQLLAVVRSVATAFRSRWVRVELERAGGGTVVAEHGTPGPRSIVLPVAYRGEQIGRLVLAPPTGLRLSDEDQRLLADVVRQAAAAHRAAQLAEELQASRKALVTAREEERRRLRRDLHDGLGPALGAVSLRIETARNLAARAPEQADALLADSVRDVSDVLADVRRLVHDLRPPALDEVGLLGALEQQATRFRRDALAVEVQGEGPLEGLPAAVEVAAYRIVSEALANVARHARASRVGVRLTAGTCLEIRVSDDGVGIDPGAPAGVGLVSLHERAGELGGSVSVDCPVGGGTVVTARLPLTAAVPAQRVDA
jgi:signal transduction histidine kinase